MGTDAATETNPLLAPWTGPFEAPPFTRLKESHFEEAFETAFTRAKAEVAAIAEDPAAPTFENTIEALEKSGADLTRVAAVFFNLASADTNEALQAIEREIAPKLARHRSKIYLNESLFQRIAALHLQRDGLGLSAEQRQVLERYHIAFLRNGGGLPQERRAVSTPPANPRFNQQAATAAMDDLKAAIALLKQQTAARVTRAASMRRTWKGPYADQFFERELPRMRSEADAMIAEMLGLLKRISSASAAAAAEQRAYQSWQEQQQARQSAIRGH